MAQRKYFLHFTEKGGQKTLHFHIPWANYYRNERVNVEEVMQSRTKFMEKLDRDERKLFMDRWQSALLDALVHAHVKGPVVLPHPVLLTSLPEQFHYDYRLRKTVISVPLSPVMGSIPLERIQAALSKYMRANETLLARAPR